MCNSPRELSGTHKAVESSGVVQELLTEAGRAEGLHAPQANGPQEALLQQGRSQRDGLHAGQSQLHEDQPVHHSRACRDNERQHFRHSTASPMVEDDQRLT